jgi:hypothetical protein
MESCLTLLGHENVDVSTGVMDVLVELLDPALLVALRKMEI